MRRFLLLFLLLCIYCLLPAEMLDLSWNSPSLGKLITKSWLLENNEEIPSEVSSQPGYNLAISSVDKFKQSLINYFSYKDNEANFFCYQPQDNKGFLQVNLRTGADFASADSSYHFLHYGWQLCGRVTDRISFYSEFWTGHFSDDNMMTRNSPLIDCWKKVQDGTIYLDNLRGKLLYSSDALAFGLGRGRYQTGSSITGSIILADNCNDYGYWHLDLHLGDFTFSTMNVSLTADESSYNEIDTTAEYSYHENKRLTIHNLSWTPVDSWKLFIGEEVIYGVRGTDLSYLVPVNFIRAIEHNLGDKDNVMIYAGWEYRAAANLFYGNMLLDELRKSEIFGDWWGNKYALQIGDALYLGNKQETMLTLEFTAVRPWLYTHKSYLTRYSHDNKGLGFPEGSNLMQIAIAAKHDFCERLNCAVTASFIRQGNTGNSWEMNYTEYIEDTYNEETKWFAGNPENRIKLQGIINWQPLAHHWLKLGAESIIYDNDTQTELYFSWLTRY